MPIKILTNQKIDITKMILGDIQRYRKRIEILDIRKTPYIVVNTNLKKNVTHSYIYLVKFNGDSNTVKSS